MTMAGRSLGGNLERVLERAAEPLADGGVHWENHARTLFYFAVIGR